MQVITRELSGLGNQFFQYAAGLYFAQKYGGDLCVFNEPEFGVLSHGQFDRPFLLPKFSIEAPIRSKTRMDGLMLSLSPRSQTVSAPFRALARVAVRHESLEQRHHFIEDLCISETTRTLYLSGYWQSYKYAQAVAPQLYRQLRLREAATGRNLEMLQQIQAAATSVSLHIRRGDYTLAAEGNIALSLSYYRAAIDLVRAHYSDPTFFIFSDDLSFARENLPSTIKRVFVEGNDDLSSQEDLRLMASCQHHIIANSSFSWWGAWMNPSKDKFVVAPKHWKLTPDSVFPDLLPPEWHMLDSLRQS